MKTIWPVARITLKEGLRSRIIFGVILGGIVVIFLAIFISGLFMRDLLKILLNICLSSVSIGGLLVPFFISVSLLAGDIENRTIFTILAKQVSRASYIIGKFLGLGMLAGCIMTILTGATLTALATATLIFPAYMFEDLAVPPVLLSILASFAGVLVLNSCVFLWATITTSSILATLLTLTTYVVGQSTEAILRFLSAKVAGVKISPLVEYTVQVVQYIFPNLSAFDLKYKASYGLTITTQEIGYLTLYAVVYSAIMLSLAIFFFNRRDLK